MRIAVLSNVGLLLFSLILIPVEAHRAGHHPVSTTVSVYSPPSPADGTSGQGELKFKVLYAFDHLPEEAQRVLKEAHGGFAIDRRPDRGEVYFALPGAGIIQLSRDLASARLIETPSEMQNVNLHNTTIWYGPEGQAFLTFPANDAGAVYTTTLQGKLLQKLDAPGGRSPFAEVMVREYFDRGGKFAPTDVEQLGRLFYVTTGYSPLDFVLTARLTSFEPLNAAWDSLAFGGKGDSPGQFGTGHGITLSPAETLDVADRPNAEIERFSPDGEFLSSVNLPEGSFPCDVDYLEKYATVACLHGPDRSLGAPVYILRDGEVVSTIMPREELGLSNFQHIHNAVLHRAKDRLFLIIQSWNPGDFAVLEQVID